MADWSGGQIKLWSDRGLTVTVEQGEGGDVFHLKIDRPSGLRSMLDAILDGQSVRLDRARAAGLAFAIEEHLAKSRIRRETGANDCEL